MIAALRSFRGLGALGVNILESTLGNGCKIQVARMAASHNSRLPQAGSCR